VLKNNSIDVVISDIKMPVMDGIEMAEKIKKTNPDIPIIITTAFSEVPYLIKSIKIGVSRYIQKPMKIKNLIEAIYEVVLPKIQSAEIKALMEELTSSYSLIFGNSPSMEKVTKLLRTVALTDFSILLQGETGVGKSFVAHRIHNISKRSKDPFIQVDIATIPENLIESELFGHVKGAFTGAEQDKKGFFHKANRGTIFIDELENIPLNVQAKLLRVMDEKKIYQVGSTEAIHINARIICSTNINTSKLLKQNQLREDLYYRLNEFSVTIPPLRERIDDIENLASLFLEQVCAELTKESGSFSKGAIDLLKKHSWPGNVRELKNVVRRSALFSNGPTVKEEEVSEAIMQADFGGSSETIQENSLTLSEAMERVEKEIVEKALEKTKWKKLKTAEILGIDYKTLIRKIEKYGIDS